MANDIEIIKKLRNYSKNYFSVADLVKILDQTEPEIYTTLTRLAKRGVLIRINRGYYAVYGEPIDEEAIACQIYYPSYVSLETILSRSGLINQIPQVLTMVTTNRSKNIELIDKSVRYRQIQKDLFFGYFEKNSAWMAYPEKALLDKLYFVYRGRSGIDFTELDMKSFNQKRWNKYKRNFPTGMSELINKIDARL